MCLFITDLSQVRNRMEFRQKRLKTLNRFRNLDKIKSQTSVGFAPFSSLGRSLVTTNHAVAFHLSC
jgi:hypothetical protein